MMKKITIKTNSRSEFVKIDKHIQAIINETEIKSGICYIFIPHTTAGVTINENADPNVPRDIISQLSKLVPSEGGYKHIEENADAHIKSSLIGVSQIVLIENGKLLLGTWQSVFFCEFDGPRTREIWIKVTTN
jgi:secondary thiamine-phosphate synthase enzyme